MRQLRAKLLAMIDRHMAATGARFPNMAECEILRCRVHDLRKRLEAKRKRLTSN